MPPMRRPGALTTATATRRRRGLRASLLAAVLLGLASSPASADVLRAAPASTFRDSQGVQMHHPFGGYAYDKDDPRALSDMLKTIGIWHVRDTACVNLDEVCARTASRMVALKNALGPGAPTVDYILGVTRELEGTTDRATRDQDIENALVQFSTPPLSTVVAGLEEVNEPDLQKHDDWPATTIADDATLRRLLQQPRFAALRKLPLLGPPLGRSKATADLLDAGWDGSQIGVPNFHPYAPAYSGPEVAMDRPCIDATGANSATGLKTPLIVELSLVDKLACVKRLATGAAPIATESGYSTANNPVSTSWVSEQAQAIYLPRLLLDNFAHGVSRTYLYEMIDLSPDYLSVTNGYGMWKARLTNSGYGSAGAKGSAYAMQRFNARIGDAGAKPLAGVLDVTLRNKAGAVVPETTIKKVLLRRKDGSYVLALWQPKAVFDNTVYKQRNINIPDIGVSLSINSRTFGSWTATAFRPNVDNDAFRWTNAKTIKFGVGPDVTLLDLRSAWSPAKIPGGAFNLRTP